MMGPLQHLKTAFTPRLQRLMRGVDEPYLRPPFVQTIRPAHPAGIVPWNAGMGYASVQPKANPAFSDAWVIGATGGANRVIPQGIDYSRTPCCAPNGMSGPADTATLLVGLVAVPAVLLGFTVLSTLIGGPLGGPSRRRNRRSRRANPGGTIGFWRTYLVHKLIRYDMRESKKESKRGGGPNIYRLGHLLGAAHKIDDDIVGMEDRDDDEALTAFQNSMNHHFVSSFSPVAAVNQAIEKYRQTGVRPKIK